jgi:hypothetical protein
MRKMKSQVPLLEYIVGRYSGQYDASHPSWYRQRIEKHIHKFGFATVADYAGDNFPPRRLQQETPSISTPISLQSASRPQPPAKTHTQRTIRELYRRKLY